MSYGALFQEMFVSIPVLNSLVTFVARMRRIAHSTVKVLYRFSLKLDFAPHSFTLLSQGRVGTYDGEPHMSPEYPRQSAIQIASFDEIHWIIFSRSTFFKCDPFSHELTKCT